MHNLAHNPANQNKTSDNCKEYTLWKSFRLFLTTKNESALKLTVPHNFHFIIPQRNWVKVLLMMQVGCSVAYQGNLCLYTSKYWKRHLPVIMDSSLTALAMTVFCQEWLWFMPEVVIYAKEQSRPLFLLYHIIIKTGMK